MNTEPPSKSWIYNMVLKTDFKIVTRQSIEFERHHLCDTYIILFYIKLHESLFNRPPCLILNMDETICTAKRRLKVLSRKGKIPLIPEAVKVPHLTCCVTFTASGYVFDPLIILPNKKTLRILEDYEQIAFFASSLGGWNTSKIFTYYCLLLVCQLSKYKIDLPENLKCT